MTHPLPDERLSLYLDGELTADEASRLEAELAADPALQAELDELHAVVSLLADEGPVRAPLGFHHAVMQRIDEEYPPAAAMSWWAWLRRPFGVPLEGLAVAAVALMVLAVVGLPGSTPPADLPAPEWRDVPDGEAAPAALKLKEPGEKPVVAPPPRKEAPVKGAAEAGSAEAEADRATPPPAVKEEAVDAKKAPSPKPAPPPLRSVPNSYDLFTEDVASLRALLALVGRLGGSVTDLDGHPIQSAEMTTSRRDVMISLPQEALTDFQAELQRLGTARPRFDDDRLLSRDTIELQVSVQLSGGGVGDGEGEKRPYPRKKRAFDDMAEPMEMDAPE